MLAGNSTTSLFRFTQLRPPRRPPAEKTVALVPGSAGRRLAEAPWDRRGEVAGDVLAAAGRIVAEIDAAPAAAAVRAGLRAAAAGKAERVSDLADIVRRGLGDAPEEGLGRLCEIVADLLLAAKFAARGSGDLPGDLADLYRVAAILRDGRAERLAAEPIAAVLALPLVLPPALAPRPAAPRPSPPGGRRAPAVAGTGSPVAAATSAARALAALRELEALDRPDNLASDDDEDTIALALKGAARSRLGEGTRAVLAELGLDAARTSLPDLVGSVGARVEREARAAAMTAAGVSVMAPPPIDVVVPAPETPPQPAGVVDLLVVRQQLMRYERTDIAHVETAMIGETRSRTHRVLERVEETIRRESESTTERENQLETAERFELARETERTIATDQSIGASLSVSGKYGPTVEFGATTEAQLSVSTSETERNASTYAREVVERSLERVKERVVEERVRRMLREEEETNTHAQTNATDRHVNGIYQFLEKVYQSRIFDYGRRAVFDFMVPEPASYLWHLEGTTGQPTLPQPPDPLEDHARDATVIDESNYRALAARYGTQDVAPPPPPYVRAALALTNINAGGERDQPVVVKEDELEIPEGYSPHSAVVAPSAFTDDALSVCVTVGDRRFDWLKERGTDVEGVHLVLRRLVLQLWGTDPFVSRGKLPIIVAAYETFNFGVTVTVLFRRTDATFAAWQMRTWSALKAAYEEQLLTHRDEVARLRAEAEAMARARPGPARFGDPPSVNERIMRAELKKHCITLLVRHHFGQGSALDASASERPDDPPTIDLAMARIQGPAIRFIEQAFEWDQMQFVLYPYFWAARGDGNWARRFQRREVDTRFLEFLQAGAARVVVPVRPGFVEALAHLLETGEPWRGEGTPPVTSELYLPIVTEIAEREGAPRGEVPYGEPWETRVPTPLVVLRTESDLPRWELADEATWTWREADGA